MDLVFVVDGSGSICTNSNRTRNTCVNWELIRTFLRDLVFQLVIGPDDVRVALVLFADQGVIVWNLNEYVQKYIGFGR